MSYIQAAWVSNEGNSFKKLVVNGQNGMVWCLKEYTKLKQVLGLFIVLGYRDGNLLKGISIERNVEVIRFSHDTWWIELPEEIGMMGSVAK